MLAPPSGIWKRRLDLLAGVPQMVLAYTEHTCSLAQERTPALGQALSRPWGKHHLETQK